MWKIISSAVNICHRQKAKWIKYCVQDRRFLLTEAYRCLDAWEKRLQEPVLQNIKLDEMFYELDQKFQQNGRASVIDIDLFANAATEETHMDELEDVLHKLRLSPNTVDMLPSTPHAFIRLLLQVGQEQHLLQILNDRLNYGIFLDDYCCALLMDTFIKSKDYTGAAQVSTLQMLQEDWDNPLVAHLALYSCHMHLKEPGQWSLGNTEQPDTSEGTEEVKIRVKYVRNPFFDDHFDLCDPNLLIGKTLASLTVPMRDDIDSTYHLVGLSLYQKWEKCILLLQQFCAKKQRIFKKGVTMVEELLKKHSTEVLSENTKCEIAELIQVLKESGLVVEGDLHKAVFDRVILAVKTKEEEVIKAQEKVYQSWEHQRLEALRQQITAFRVQQRLTKVQQEKDKLLEKEKVLFFFDNEEKWDLVIDNKRVFHPKRYFGKKKKKRVGDESYVPPEV